MFAGRAAARSARVAAPRFQLAAPTRSFAEAAAKPASASTRPPIDVFGVDGTYASALYTAAAKNSSIETVSKALESLSATFKKEPKLQQILASPTLTVDDKKQIIAELQKGISVQDKTNTVSGFLNTLAENNRLSVLEGVTEKFAQLMSASRGEVELNITSAAPLDNKVIKQLEAAVSKSQYVGANKKVKVVAKVNPDIRGGLVVEIGDRTIDLSVSSKMHKMNRLLQETL
ncbi:putative oligomycin sensitivity conferring protein [Sphaerulina musiva SO2202]|uniref:ATP synthase subunit 5, mitochondrial n=1 Tax=Sphaerulina musiva (strain SO2202) TaxID=692275 RepID=N1QNV5_SPHMS|nr:putative oligomycin sensitivity conferring protein [Sphaerulina musiva SO2202]EMF17679.1 putative oligomycin sensitivity conferring protein [Sphaerulina musiva SO2202]